MHEEDARSLLPKTEFTRREFVMTALAAGFALAVRPVSAQTITTEATGLEAGEIKIPVPDGEIPAYRALPAAGGPFRLALRGARSNARSRAQSNHHLHHARLGLARRRNPCPARAARLGVDAG